VRPQTATSSNDYRARQMMIPLEDEPESLRIALMLDTHHINEILESGLRVTLVSSGLTLLFVLAVGLWLARSFTRPIFKLVAVAQAMAEGDLTSRANLSHHDEIGQLGRAVDQAIITIANLLDQQARAAGERQAILQSIADGVLAVDNDERIIIINPTAAAILGVENDALIDQPLEYLADVSEDPTMSVGLQQIVSQIRSELVDPDMAPTEERASLGNRIVRIHSTPTLVQDQTRTGAVVVLQDITRIVEADRAKSEFIATASHELRTPLTSLKGFVDVFGLSGTDNLNDNQQMFLEIIKRQTDSMVQMVNDLLEVARLEQGIQRAERRWVHPEQAIAEAQTSLRSLIEQRRVTIQTDLPEKMPCIWIDYLHLRRILTNLVSNAVKYVHHGGNVWIRAYELDDPAHLSNSQHMLPWKHREERSLVFVVEDDGVGIRTEDQPKIFTRFFRSENALSVEVGGTGLGLAVTRALVELHEGQIGFWSEENQGSRFWVRMPTPSTAPLDEEQTEQLHAHAQSDHSG
jgi:PAS domain S-box-containing protein